MITRPRCNKQSPDGSTCCQHCGFPGDKPPVKQQANIPQPVAFPQMQQSAPMQSHPQMNQPQMNQPQMNQPPFPSISNTNNPPFPPISNVDDRDNSAPRSINRTGSDMGTGKRGFFENAKGEFTPSLKDMLLFMLANCIPFYGIYLIIKVGFGKDAPPIKSAFMKASLIVAIAGSVIGGIIMAISAAATAAAVSSFF